MTEQSIVFLKQATWAVQFKVYSGNICNTKSKSSKMLRWVM